MNNLLISYDLYNPGQNYQTMERNIHELGDAIKVHQSFWYVKSVYSAENALNYLKLAIDQNDKVYVVDATNNDSWWCHSDEQTSKFILQRWEP